MPGSGVIQRRVFISGRVQGVGFRASTREEARKHPFVKGFVRNLQDGRVEAVFSGPKDDVLALVQWCGNGPVTARVNGVEVREESPDPALGFF